MLTTLGAGAVLTVEQPKQDFERLSLGVWGVVVVGLECIIGEIAIGHSLREEVGHGESQKA